MTDLPTSRFQSPQQIGTLDALDEYWRTKAGEHAMPSRADLDPAEFRYALGNVSLIDVVGDPPRFRFRVAASNVEARFDRALTGTYIEDLPEPESARLWDKVYRTVLATGRPQTFVGVIVEDEVPRLYRATIWPLASNHRDIDMLLCCREPVDEAERCVPDTPESWTGTPAAPGD
ncbi:MAG: PAS domain-containing protein [Kiloniellales bacterium]|nr:PAS domain-containing protein [Kiloniellales bacterium]